MRLADAASTDAIPHLIELLSPATVVVVSKVSIAIGRACEDHRTNHDAAVDAAPHLIALLSYANEGVVRNVSFATEHAYDGHRANRTRPRIPCHTSSRCSRMPTWPW